MNPSVGEVSWVFAFLAGVVSFLSPCVLPLIPGYISMVSKLSFEECKKDPIERKVRKILFPSVLFVLGYSFSELHLVLVGLHAWDLFLHQFFYMQALLEEQKRVQLYFLLTLLDWDFLF